MIFTLPISDFEKIVRLLSEALQPRQTITTFEKKIAFLNGLKELIDADVYVWSLWAKDIDSDDDSRMAPLPVMSAEVKRTRVKVGCLCNGHANGSISGERKRDFWPGVRLIADHGWSTEEERCLAIETLSHPDFGSFISASKSLMNTELPHFTWRNGDCVDNTAWDVVAKRWCQTGLHHSLFSRYRLPGPSISCVGFHRATSKAPFSERDIAIVDSVIGHFDWLHRDLCEGDREKYVSKLSPRERQVLRCLLRGQHKRTIARHLSISEYTVGDYVKDVYKKFDVKSQAELQAKFLFGEESLEKLLLIEDR